MIGPLKKYTGYIENIKLFVTLCQFSRSQNREPFRRLRWYNGSYTCHIMASKSSVRTFKWMNPQ